MEKSANESWKWLGPFLVIDLIRTIVLGAQYTIFGPAQPYLAKKVGVKLENITWLWTIMSGSGTIMSIIAAMTFKQYVIKPNWKLVVIAGTISLGGIPGLFYPNLETFTSLLILISIERLSTYYGETCAGGIPLYTIGPIKSRWIIMARHAFVGIGFLSGPFLVQAYFPERQQREFSELCGKNNQSLNLNGIHGRESQLTQEELTQILIPLRILSGIIIATGLMHLINICLPYKMPVYETYAQDLKNKSLASGDLKELRDYYLGLLLVTFYFATCGSERLFQAMQFIFGLCGPLKLSPGEAVIIDKCFNGGFMTGRFVSIFLVQYISPKKMLKISLSCSCLMTVILTLMSTYSASFLYLSVLLYGLALSWQFGSMYSWCSEHMDLVGTRNSFISIGCAMGGMVTPPICGYVFHRISPISIWYMNTICVILQVFSSLMLFHMLKEDKLQMKPDVKYEQLDSDEDQSKEDLTDI